MIEVGSFGAKLCAGVTRRCFVKAGFALPFGGALLGAGATRAASEAVAQESDGPRAKSVILLWLWGGPSHLDTLDPKPDAPSRYRGPFSTIPTRVPGVHFTELLPQLARRNDRFAVIRSHKNWHQGHNSAGASGLTGTKGVRRRIFGPNFGSIVSRARSRDLPPFVSIGRGRLRDAGNFMPGFGGGTWGGRYDPFAVSCSQVGDVEIPALTLVDGMTPARLVDRGRLSSELDRLEGRIQTDEFKAWDRFHELAAGLLTSRKGRHAFELADEPEELRARYGYTAFGQSCLLARRLAEIETPYIQVNWSQYVEIVLGERTDYGWDTHKYNFEFLRDRHCPILDRALSALLDDLQERGLLDSTLVVCMGEFGRTPRINNQMARDHWPSCYSSIWAGAGVQGGRVVGASDALGEHPATAPITPDQVGTTLLELAGVNSQRRAEYGVLEASHTIDELF